MFQQVPASWTTAASEQHDLLLQMKTQDGFPGSSFHLSHCLFVQFPRLFLLWFRLHSVPSLSQNYTNSRPNLRMYKHIMSSRHHEVRSAGVLFRTRIAFVCARSDDVRCPKCTTFVCCYWCVPVFWEVSNMGVQSLWEFTKMCNNILISTVFKRPWFFTNILHINQSVYVGISRKIYFVC